MSAHSERARQWVHIGSAGFALLLRVITWREAAGLAMLALVFNVFVLPRAGGQRLYRPADAARGFPIGILLYPVAVLLLIVTFRTRLDLVAAAWAVLAFGDGFATLAGQRVARQRLPWNPDKSVAGSVAFVLCGAAGATGFALWTRPAVTPPPTVAFTVAASVLAAIAAALVESIPVRLDDNLSVPAAAGATLWLASLVTPDAWSASRQMVIGSAPLAVLFNTVVAWLGYRAGTVSVSGAVGGAVIGAAIFSAAGANAWLLLFLSFLAATLASRLGLRRKQRLGIAEARGGRRGAGNAFANCGVATIAAILAATTRFPAEWLLALTAALTAGASDTVASEIGKAWGRTTVLATTLRRVPPGTPGAMSLEGTAAGVVAAAALGAAAAAMGLITATSILAVVVGATAGALIESALGATLEPAGIVNNDMLNFINTATAAAIAVAIG